MALSPDDVLPPGFRLHWYQLQSLLGDGGFGITYLGRDTNLNQSVAIKEYFPKSHVYRGPDHQVLPLPETEPEFFRWGLQRFLEEARLLARFRHPHIVRVLSVFESLGTAFMVMELERGESLGRAIRGGAIGGDGDLLDLCLPVLDGLAMVHGAGFIHRDIKPNNILIRPGLGPVLIDFGSARRPHPGESTELTAIVSRGYAPFEQYDAGNEQRQGPWSDIYAMAATLYHVITGGPPADALTRGMRLLDGDPDPLLPALECAEGRYSTQLLAAVDAGLAFRTDGRPQSVEAWRAMFPDHDSRQQHRPEVRTEALDRDAAGASVRRNPGDSRTVSAGTADFDATTATSPLVLDREYLERRMLVVDDERGARTLTCRVLENLGAARVDEAADGEQALARFDDALAVPDVVLCDLDMSPMDGIELLRHLAERSVRASLVLLGECDERMLSAVEHLASSHGLTMLGSVRKPVTPDSLSRVLARLDLVSPTARDGQRAPALEIGDAALRDGIAGNVLDLVYLPKVDLHERELLGAEALVRWPGADGRCLPAGALVERVAALGLADAFSEQVLRKALAQAGRWRASGLPCTLSVNMFAASLARLDLPQRLVALAEEEGVAPADVVLEVAELDFQRHPSVPVEVLARLRLRGVGVSLDDFGTGSLSLDRLRYIPFTELKVDRSFVVSAVEERTSRVILESSVALARRLGVHVVAEGVGDEECLAMVAKLGFDAAQGFAISPPLPGDDLREWSRDWCIGRGGQVPRARRASA